MSQSRLQRRPRALKAIRKEMRKANNAQYGYDQFGMRVAPKRLASHARALQVVVSRRELYLKLNPPGPK